MKDLIIRETSQEAFDFIKKHMQVSSPEHLITSTTTAFNIEKQFPKSFKGIVNLKRVNDIRWVNKFFETVNFKLENGGFFIGNVETYTLRKRRILKKYPPVINWGVYTVDFFFKRVSPKVWGLKKVYFFITRGSNRVMSKAETLGRLYSCGFEVVEEELINGRFYFLVKKVKEPVFDYNPTYGPLITLKRQGKGGKFKNDFRITTVGKILRKFWLDELPMIINFVKRDLKIVGVRPLSNHYRSLYPKEFQERRKNYRPGLVPPFYVDLPKDLDEIIDSERRYLDAYDKHPFLTDWKYFWKAFNNIVFKRARSK